MGFCSKAHMMRLATAAWQPQAYCALWNTQLQQQCRHQPHVSLAGRQKQSACWLWHKRGSRHLCQAAQPAPTTSTVDKAALMVIGDEILKGSITDTNTPWLAKLLYSRGVDLVRVEYIPDNKQDIVDTVLRLRQRVGPSGCVFTSGGIGPTHDDVTYEALAEALGVQLVLDQPTVGLMKESYAKRGMDLNAARLRMATLPHPAEVLRTPGTWVPLVNLQGVYILPGIPKLFQSMILANQDRFTGRAYTSMSLYSVPGESFIADALTAVAKAHREVAIGSYPNTDEATEGHWKVRLAVSSRSDEALAAAVAELRTSIPHLLDKPPAS